MSSRYTEHPRPGELEEPWMAAALATKAVVEVGSSSNEKDDASEREQMEEELRRQAKAKGRGSGMAALRGSDRERDRPNRRPCVVVKARRGVSVRHRCG